MPPFGDGTSSERLKLASRANVSSTTAQTMTGADLEFAKLQRDNGNGSGVAGSGSDMEQKADNVPHIVATGEVNYAAVGGKVTRIIGGGFTGTTGVTFGGAAGTAFSVISDEVIQVTTPAKAAGSYSLVVQHPNGNATLANGVTYV